LATRIEREFEFQAGVYFEGNFIMNIYALSLVMEVETSSIKEQNIAMDRIIYFLSECLSNSVFVQSTEKKAIEKFTQADIKVCTIPDEPYDQILAIILIMKLNAITEGKLSVTDIVLSSELSDGVKFIYDIETAANNPFGKKGWWLESSTVMAEVEKTPKKEKIVRLIKHSDWVVAGLDWEEKAKKSGEIMFVPDTEKQP